MSANGRPPSYHELAGDNARLRRQLKAAKERERRLRKKVMVLAIQIQPCGFCGRQRCHEHADL